MKRHQHGINLDDGAELASPEDFNQLYVPVRDEEEIRLSRWLIDPNAKPLMLAGQIGTGKTTFLNNIVRNNSTQGIVRVEFDQIPLDETEGAFLAVLFASLLREAVAYGCNCGGLGIALSDFGASHTRSWRTLGKTLLTTPRSVAGVRRVRKLYTVFGESPQLAQRACMTLIERLSAKVGVVPSIIAEGIDKFSIASAGYFSLTKVLDFLGNYKTLYEANIIHAFDTSRRWAASNKLVLGPLGDDKILDIFRRRLGNYSSLYEDALVVLARQAGGIPRQGIRLLNEFYFHKVQCGDTVASAIAHAMHKVAQNLLLIGYERLPIDILRVITRDRFIESALFARPATREDVRLVVYRNWVLVKSTPPDKVTRWPILINPLMSDRMISEKVSPEAPELLTMREWASDQEISSIGMNIPDDQSGRLLSWNEIWNHISLTGFSRDRLNIVELLEEVAASLFSVNRQDRIMVGYRDSRNLEIAVKYLVGKASTFGPFVCRELHLGGGFAEDPIGHIMSFTSRKEEAAIYVIYMEGKWTDAQLDSLDHLRDYFSDLEMLWFVEYDLLSQYLVHWPQFRQLLRFYVFEDDYLSPLTEEEIETDLATLRSLGGRTRSGVRSLEIVLDYLKRKNSAL